MVSDGKKIFLLYFFGSLLASWLEVNAIFCNNDKILGVDQSVTQLFVNY